MFLLHLLCVLSLIIGHFNCKSLLIGDVTVAGLFSIQDNVNGECSAISPTSVKLLEAVKWTFRQLNEKNYIPGVSIGLEAWSTCQSTALASDRTVDLIYKIRQDKNTTSFTTPPLIALIGPNYSNEAEKTSYLLSTQKSEDHLLQLGFSSTAASLSNTDVYANYFRVVPSDAIQTGVMIALMVQLEWNYIAVIYDEDIYGMEGKNALTKLAAENSICIAASFSLPSGALSVSRLQEILRSIVQNSESPISGVVLFTSESHVNAIMSVASTLQNDISDPISYIISESLGLSDSYLKDVNGNFYSSAKGVYVVSPPQLSITEFDSYWKTTFKNVKNVVEESKTNDWLRNVYEFFSGCLPSTDSQNTGCQELSQSQLEAASQSSAWTSYAVKAAYVIAKVLKNFHNNVCSGQTGLCQNLKDILYKSKGSLISVLQNLKSIFTSEYPFVPNAFVNLTFTRSGRNDILFQEGFPDYEVYQYRSCLQNSVTFCFEKIGTYANQVLSLENSLIKDYHNNLNGNSWPNVNRAQCKNGRKCTSCIVHDAANEVYFKDGDILFGAIVPVYNKGTDSPLSCGGIRTTQGMEIVQAIEYATSLLNNRTQPFQQIFPGKTIGFVILNSCNQPLLIKNKLISLHKDGLILDDNNVIDVTKKIVGYVGASSSTISVASSDVLSEFGFVQIAYGSTAVSLSDRTLYPYFMRVTTPDDKQASAVISIIRHAHYDSDYIQVIYSEGAYGNAGKDAIRQAAKAQDVCIANEIEFTETSNANALIEQLRVYGFAKIVIIFIVSEHIPSVTSALDRMEYGEFLLIGSESWGYRPGEFFNKPKLAGSLVLSLQMPQNTNFTTFLNNIDISGQTINPWFQEYIQNKFDCYMSSSFDKQFSKLCDNNQKLANSVSYQQEIWTPFALNAAFALLSGSSEAFRELCGINSGTLCDQYKRNPMDIISKIKTQRLDSDGTGSMMTLFDSNGDGNVGYTIYNLQRNPDNANEVIYKQVGNFPLDGKNVVLDVNNIVYPDDIKLPSTCPNERACRICRDGENNNIVAAQSDGSSTEVIALAVLVGILVVVVVILVVIGILLYRRFKRAEKDQYIDATYEPPPRFYDEIGANVSNTGSSSSINRNQAPISFVARNNSQNNAGTTQNTEKTPRVFSRPSNTSVSSSRRSVNDIVLRETYSETKDTTMNGQPKARDSYLTPYDSRPPEVPTNSRTENNTNSTPSPSSCIIRSGSHSSEGMVNPAFDNRESGYIDAITETLNSTQRTDI